MSRFTSGLTLAAVASMLLVLAVSGTEEQALSEDAINPRVSALETQVAELDGDVVELHATVDGLSAQVADLATGPATPEPLTGTARDDGSVTFSGAGNQVYPGVALQPGRNAISCTVRVTGEYCYVKVHYSSDGRAEVLFLEMVADTAEASTENLPEAGAYIVEVEGPREGWIVVITPLDTWQPTATPSPDRGAMSLTPIANSSATSSPLPEAVVVVTENGVEISGIGDMTTDTFLIKEGVYEISIRSIDGGWLYVIYLWSTDGTSRNVSGSSHEMEPGSRDVTVENLAGGEYFLEVDLGGSWEITFTRR